MDTAGYNGFNFFETPTIFGAKARDGVNGAKAATGFGFASLSITFFILMPGANLSDFLDLINNPGMYVPVKTNFKPLHAENALTEQKLA